MTSQQEVLDYFKDKAFLTTRDVYDLIGRPYPLINLVSKGYLSCVLYKGKQYYFLPGNFSKLPSHLQKGVKLKGLSKPDKVRLVQELPKKSLKEFFEELELLSDLADPKLLISKGVDLLYLHYKELYLRHKARMDSDPEYKKQFLLKRKEYERRYMQDPEFITKRRKAVREWQERMKNIKNECWNQIRQNIQQYL